MFYGHLEEILAFSYIFRNRVLLFKCKWFDTDPKKKRLLTYKNITSIFINSEWYKDDPFILASQAKQVFYIVDPLNGPNQSVVQEFTHRRLCDILKTETTQEEIVQDRVDFLYNNDSSCFLLIVDLGELQLLTDNRNDVTSEVIPNNMIRSSRQLANDDDFINDAVDEDKKLEDYVDEEFGEDDNETDKESTGDEQLEYYSETHDD